jgi:hypothetical protein
MLRIKTLGLALVAVFMMGAVAASSAMATHQWLINGSPATSALKVHLLGLLLLADLKAIGGEVKIHCHGSADGTIGPSNLDLILAITKELLGTNDKITCSFDKKGACTSATATALAVNLPWLTLIKLVGTEVRDVIEKDPNGGATGNPGWKVTCGTALGEVTDECTLAEGNTGLKTVAGVGVEAIFDVKSPKANCSQGGAGTGEVSGPVTTYNPSTSELLSFE